MNQRFWSCIMPRAGARAVAWLFAGAMALSAAPVAAQFASELGEAPRRDEPQELTGRVYAPRPEAAKTRSEVVQIYRTQYLPGSSVPLNWTGSVAGCNPGTTNIEHQQAVIARVNFYRALVDLPGVTLTGGLPTTQVQAAALMMAANNSLNHFPPTTWLCYSADGATAAGSSNISLGTNGLGNGVGAIDGYMDDFGPGNTATGHRRWILHPPRTGMATGDTVGGATPPPFASNVLHVFGPTGPRPPTPNGVAWPPAGFIPYQNLPIRSNRWSWSFPGADFTNATVAMTGPGGAIVVVLEPLATGFGDNTLVWRPTGVAYTKLAADTTYAITISGLGGAGVPASISYTVTVIDPDAVVSGPVTAIAIEFYNASLDHYFLTHIAGEIAILDAGVTIRGWTRTGESFKVFIAPGAGTSPVCRYYIPPDKGDSHFYGRGTVECNATGAANPSFINEDSQFFHVVLPVAGVCPAGLGEAYRVFSNRLDANHRYMIDLAIRNLMTALGWLAEGDGPNLVVMCVPV